MTTSSKGGYYRHVLLAPFATSGRAVRATSVAYFHPSRKKKRNVLTMTSNISYSKAIALLERCSSKQGFLASAQNGYNYKLVWALKSHNHFTENPIKDKKIAQIAECIIQNFSPERVGEKYHKRAYEVCNLKNYMPCSFSPAGYKTQFDGFANSLALLLNSGTSDFRNYPNEFHNGGSWPIVNGFFGLALLAKNEKTKATHLLTAINSANARNNSPTSITSH